MRGLLLSRRIRHHSTFFLQHQEYRHRDSARRWWKNFIPTSIAATKYTKKRMRNSTCIICAVWLSKRFFLIFNGSIVAKTLLSTVHAPASIPWTRVKCVYLSLYPLRLPSRCSVYATARYFTGLPLHVCGNSAFASHDLCVYSMHRNLNKAINGSNSFFIVWHDGHNKK